MAVNENFWNALHIFSSLQLSSFPELSQPIQPISPANEKHLEEKAKCGIENIVGNCLLTLSQEGSPVLRIPKKSSSEDGVTVDSEDLVSLAKPQSTRRFTILFDILSKSHSLLSSGAYSTRRDIYYQDVPLYGNQRWVDMAVEEAALMLGVPRRILHITATGKGLVAGSLSFVTRDHVTVNVSHAAQGMLIPDDVVSIHQVASDARFVLVVEKDATFQKLIDAHFLRSFGPCILITGKGYPDLCTRQFLYKLWRVLRLPVLALCDADPYGIHIASVYKFGALCRDDPDLKVGALALLGILPTDLRGLQLPKQTLMPLVPRDYGKLAAIEAHPSLAGRRSWLQEIDTMRKGGVKVEIQSLTHIAPDYLTSVYLPTKLRTGSWII